MSGPGGPTGPAMHATDEPVAGKEEVAQ